MRTGSKHCFGALLVVASAVVDLSPAIAQQADPVQAQLNEAAGALQRGQLDQAIQSFTDALADKGLSNDRRAMILADRGVAHMRRQAYKPAIDDFNRAVQLSPEFAPTYNNRGNALIAVGVLREAIKDFDRAIVLSPSYSAAYANRASAYFRLNNKDQALADYGRAIELTPQSVSALNGRGLLQLAADRPHAALRDFSRALALDIRFAAGYRNRATAKAVLERNEEAIEDLSRAITFDARNVASHLLRGDFYLAVNNQQSALKDYNRAIELAPKAAEAFVGRALTLAKLDSFDDALNDLAKAIELDPKAARAYAVRAWVYKQMQQLDLGQRDMERSLKLEPLTADALWAQGELDDARGRAEPAIQAFTKALGIDPRHRLTLDSLNRLGLVATREETEVAAAGAEGWRVIQSGDQYFAINPQFATMRVPLEMLGKGTPKIVAWERQKAPNAGYGILRFAAGRQEPPGRPPEDLEAAAVVDIQALATLGLTLNKKGNKAATWTWDEGRLVVASAEGITEEFALKSKGSTVAAASDKSGQPRSPTSQSGGGSSGKSSNNGVAWAPWSQGSSSNQPPARQASRSQQKPKSLFEMLFGN